MNGKRKRKWSKKRRGICWNEFKNDPVIKGTDDPLIDVGRKRKRDEDGRDHDLCQSQGRKIYQIEKRRKTCADGENENESTNPNEDVIVAGLQAVIQTMIRGNKVVIRNIEVVDVIGIRIHEAVEGRGDDPFHRVGAEASAVVVIVVAIVLPLIQDDTLGLAIAGPDPTLILLVIQGEERREAEDIVLPIEVYDILDQDRGLMINVVHIL